MLDLTEEELAVIVDRIIEASNPNAPDNIVEWNFAEETFKQLPSVEQTEIHYSDDGYVHVYFFPFPPLSRKHCTIDICFV